TKSARLGILAERAAPMQGHYLGYPGTTGARFVDFFVADDVTVPPSHESSFTERIARVPGCYQPNDRSRPAPAGSSRESHGLPARGLVFCSFNQPIKITAAVFSRWCALLQAVPGAVLWLSALDPRA